MEGKDIIKKDKGSVERTRNIRTVSPLVDIYENEEEILLHAEMPGVKKQNVNVNIDNGRLTVTGVRELAADGAVGWEEFGDVSYERAFSVPQSIDIKRVNAELKDGILALHLPKSEAAKPKQIEIRAV